MLKTLLYIYSIFGFMKRILVKLTLEKVEKRTFIALREGVYLDYTEGKAPPKS